VRHPLLSLLRAVVLLPSYTVVLLVRMLKWSIAPPALLLQLLVGAPLALLRVRQPLRPRFLPLQDVDLPDAAWLELTDAAETLAAEGFVRYGDFRCDELIQGATVWLRLLSQPEQGIGALAVHVELAAGIQPSRSFVEFATAFADGRLLTTNNLDLPYSLPAPAFQARLQLKDVWDPRALCLLHRGLVTALARPIDRSRLDRVAHDPAGLLVDSYTREIQALIAQGWLRPDADGRSIRLSPWGALMGTWHQAWPLAGLHLRAADRRARRLFAEHALDVEAFTGGAPQILVAYHPLPLATAIATIRAGYEQVRPLARQTDPQAVLEAVVVELDLDAAGSPRPCEFRYTFRACDDQRARRIRRIRGFDIVLDRDQAQLAVTAMDREFEQAVDDPEWDELTEDTPLAPLRLGPWLRDIDQILPAAWAALAAHTVGQRPSPDSAALYPDEDGAAYWQIVAWGEDDRPLHVTLDARSGTEIED
jgi:hypothetical protein